MDLLPWHQRLYQNALERIASGRFPHALILSAPIDNGKLFFARAIAKALLCESGTACGSCSSCKLIEVNNHIDLIEISPEEKKTGIDIEAIRNLSEKLSASAMLRHNKVAILWPADSMSHSAANALLKTLEEPSPDTFIILSSARPARLPATIRSRCQCLNLVPVDKGPVAIWLSNQGVDAAVDTELLAYPLLVNDGDRLRFRQEVQATLLRLARAELSALAAAEVLAKQPLAATLDYLYQWTGKQLLAAQNDLKLARRWSISNSAVANYSREGLVGLNARMTLESILLGFPHQSTK